MMTVAASEHAEHDSDFYFTDGNIVLRVENTLFRVHKFILERESTFFKDLFSIPQPDSSDEGKTDENPIVLSGDSAAEFHALLWSLYALPAAIFLESINPNAERFGAIASMAHKYQFTSTEGWAAGRLESIVDQWNTGKVQFTASEAARVTKAAVLCKPIAPDLYECVVRAWKKLIMEDQGLSIAVDIGETYGITEIEGLAFYRLMLQGRDSWLSQDPPLSRVRRIRLLNGHYTILKMASELADNPPKITHCSTCTRNSKCTKYWQGLWKTITEPTTDGLITQMRSTIKCYPSDYLQQLMLAESFVKAFVDKKIEMDNITRNIPEDCLRSGMKATGERIRETRLRLLDYFTDVE